MGIKLCPDCGGKVAESRDTCPHCGHKFEGDVRILCPECGEMIMVKADHTCPVCGHMFTDDAAPKLLNIEESFGEIKVISCNNDYATTIVIPEGVTVIGKKAFKGLKYLEKVTLPKSLKIIDDEAFMDCSKLEIKISDNVDVFTDAIKNTKTDNDRLAHEAAFKEAWDQIDNIDLSLYSESNQKAITANLEKTRTKMANKTVTDNNFSEIIADFKSYISTVKTIKEETIDYIMNYDITDMPMMYHDVINRYKEGWVKEITNYFDGIRDYNRDIERFTKYVKDISAIIEIGDIVTFGRYTQGAQDEIEPIKWIVIEVDTYKKQVLLLSQYLLDFKKYDEIHDSTTWEKCTLRSWLNQEFFAQAFNSEEEKQIPLATVDNHSDGSYDLETTQGADTKDKVFLLSWADSRRLFKKMENRTIPDINLKGETKYCEKLNPATEENIKWAQKFGWSPKSMEYWLRSIEYHGKFADVNWSTNKDCDQKQIGTKHYVRPAIYLKIN